MEKAGEKADTTPKAIECYGVLRADTDQMLLRFVEGRPVSAVTIKFLPWIVTRLARESNRVFVLVWDNASGISGRRCGSGYVHTIDTLNEPVVYEFSPAACPPKAPGSIRSNQSGCTVSEPLSSLYTRSRRPNLLRGSVITSTANTSPTLNKRRVDSALVREALREQDQRQERKAWEGLGFGGVMRPEPRESASTRQEPGARGRVHAPRE